LKNGGWKTGCALTKSKGIRGRVLEQIMEKIDGKSTEEVNQILETDSGICFTLDECVDLVRKHPTLVDIVTRIAERSPGFQVYEDPKSRAFDEVVYAGMMHAFFFYLGDSRPDPLLSRGKYRPLGYSHSRRP